MGFDRAGADDPGMAAGIEALMAHQAEQGAFETLMSLYKRFAGIDGEHWVWMACDAPTLLYALLSFELADDARVQRALDHLVGLAEDNGWRYLSLRGALFAPKQSPSDGGDCSPALHLQRGASVAPEKASGARNDTSNLELLYAKIDA